MKTVERYCDIGGFDPESDRDVFFGHDGSECTLIRVNGVSSIMSDEEFRLRTVDRVQANLAQAFRGPGHALTISFESGQTVDEQIRDLVMPLRENAERKGLNVGVLIDETAEVVRSRARFERMLVGCWTRPGAGYAQSIAADRKRNREKVEALPPMQFAQNPHLALASLESRHDAFVGQVRAALRQSGLEFEVLGPSEDGRRLDLSEVRKALFYYETPPNWSPHPAGDVKYPSAKAKHDSDVSGFFAPTVASQLMASNAASSNDFRDVSLGSRQFAPVVMRRFPVRLVPFRDLARAMSSSRRERTPFRVALHLEGMDRGVTWRLREVLSTMFSLGFLGQSGAANKRLGQNLRNLDRVANDDEDALVRAQLFATTWVEPDERPELLSARRAKLMQAMSAWGDGLVTDAPRDPLAVVVGSVPGMSAAPRVSRPAIGPVSDMATLLPFHSVAPPFEKGETLYLSPDDRVIPQEAFSHKQQSWLKIIDARPGSGKSVLVNRENFEFAAYSAGSKLPFIGIADVGVSASGFIKLMQEALPDDQKHLVVGSRLQKTPEYAVNFFDTGLGNRQPLDLEMTFSSNFLMTLADTSDEQFLKQFRLLVPRVIKRVYDNKNDIAMSSHPNRYEEGAEPDVDREIANRKIQITERTSWWRLCDVFMEMGLKRLAYRCHCRAMPLLPDVSRVLSERDIKDDFGEELLRIAKRSLENAAERFPSFSYPTKLDFGPARIVLLDLNDVLEHNDSEEAHRANTLWYMTALQALISKISGKAADIDAMEFPRDMKAVYQKHWRRHYQDVEETQKRIVLDEFHNTGGLPTIRLVIDKYVRQGRKWNLEMILASQKIEDFGTLKDLASTIVLMNAETEEEREKFQEMFGFSDAVRNQMRAWLHGPREGARFLVNYKLEEDERWMILSNAMGGRQLWALTTKQEDRAIRDELYRRLGVTDTLTLLGERFAGGTAIELWNEFKKSAGANESIAELMADELIGDFWSVRTTRRKKGGRRASPGGQPEGENPSKLAAE